MKNKMLKRTLHYEASHLRDQGIAKSALPVLSMIGMTNLLEKSFRRAEKG